MNMTAALKTAWACLSDTPKLFWMHVIPIRHILYSLCTMLLFNHAIIHFCYYKK